MTDRTAAGSERLPGPGVRPAKRPRRRPLPADDVDPPSRLSHSFT